MDIPCRFEDGAALGRFHLPDGCIAYPDDRYQDLCLHHAVRSQPGSTIELIQDYTLDSSFSDWWKNRQ